MLGRVLNLPMRPHGIVRGPRAVVLARAKAAGGKKKGEAKEKKVFVPTWDPKDLPTEPVAKLAFVWERVMAPGTTEDVSIPWKQGEEPEWAKTLIQSNLDVTKTPSEFLDPKVVGYGYQRKRARTEMIKLKNYMLSKGNFKILGKPSRRKQTAP